MTYAKNVVTLQRKSNKKMFCKDIHSALEAITGRYEEVVFVHDERIPMPAVSGQHPVIRIEVSEETKGIETVEKIWDRLIETGMTRRGLLVAIGGGALTDMAGFAAATYKRGIEWVAVPTTLLAMVDASTGGKTGINYRGMKNMIGAFYPPIETIIWPGWLKTLPTEEMLSGFGEIIKMSAVSCQKSEVSCQKSERLWDRVMRYDLERMDIGELEPIIEECVAAKERIVAADPREEGLRKVLNFGHTFGHALEEIMMDNSQLTMHNAQLAIIPHGYAVVYGMIAELYLSVVKSGCPKEPLQLLTQTMLHYYGKPQCGCKDRESLLKFMQQDKKNEHAGEINCTLIRRIGEPIINQVISPDEAREAWEYLFSL